jgi:hypothetical protein
MTDNTFKMHDVKCDYFNYFPSFPSLVRKGYGEVKDFLGGKFEDSCFSFLADLND